MARADDPRTTFDEFRQATFAYNQTFSQSGYAAPFWHLKPLGFWFENRLHTEQHLESARAVAEGRADIASLDAVSWRLALRYEPFTAVERAIVQLTDEDRGLLGIKGLVRIAEGDYLAVLNPEGTS